MNLKEQGLTYLINKNYFDPEKAFNISKPDISFIIAYQNEIDSAKDIYQNALLARIDLMKELLPYLYLTEHMSQFKNLYEKVIFITNETPDTLEIFHTEYKIHDLKQVYKQALSQTIYNCYYELVNNSNMKTAEVLLKDIKTFSPSSFIRY